MLTKVKICGIKTLEEVALINNFPVSYMGLIFASSKRQVTLEMAKSLRDMMRKDIIPVGVFVNASLETIREAVKVCGLGIVQLHGEESVDFCMALEVPVWKSISIKDEESLHKVHEYGPQVAGILLDTYSPSEKGGTGITFNWRLVEKLSSSYPIILAGGLTPDNVVEAIRRVNPMVVDMNSGLETNLIKDPQKVKRAFEQLICSQ